MHNFEFVSKSHQALYATDEGQAYWHFLNEPVTVKCMCVATFLGKPAILGVEEDLIARFNLQERTKVAEGDKSNYDRLKQMLGQMTRQIMEHHGYQHRASNVKTPNSKIFYSASVYEKQATI